MRVEIKLHINRTAVNYFHPRVEGNKERTVTHTTIGQITDFRSWYVDARGWCTKLDVLTETRNKKSMSGQIKFLTCVFVCLVLGGGVVFFGVFLERGGLL